MKNLIYLFIILSILVSCGESIFEPNSIITASFKNEISKEQKKETIEIIKNRLKAYSVESVIDIESNNINIKIENKKNKINSIAIEKLISKKGNLNFVPTYNNTTLGDKIFNISNRIISKTPILSFYLYPNVNDSGEWNESPILGNAKLQDTAIINNYLKRKQLTDSLPNDLSFNWATEPSAASDYGDLLIDLYLIKKSNSESLIITNTQIEKVKNTSDLLKKNAIITFKFTEKGAEIWSDLTEKSVENKTDIALMIDDNVFSAPKTNTKITEGEVQIIGGKFKGKDAGNTAYKIVTIFKYGMLPININSIITTKLNE